MRLLRWLGGGVMVVVGVGIGAASPDDGPLPPARPTVTLETGDTGGLFFGKQPEAQKVRRYYVAAEAVPWDFAPTGRDDVCGLTLPPAVVKERTREKLRYLHYTDETFTTRAIPNRTLGIMGPVLRGVVGEFIVVTFFNRTTQPLSMHPHGVHYDKDSEGAYYRPGPGKGAAVGPGAKFTYVWQLDEQSGPLPGEPSSKGWLYHSHVAGDAETNQGLIGAIIVTDPKRARPDGTPVDVDREFATLFMIFDESGLDAATVTAAEQTGPVAGEKISPEARWAKVQQRTEEGARYAINGYIYGNLPGLDMNEGERTRWYLFGLGSEQDFHTAHWHGLRVVEEGRRRTDVVELLPASMKVADMVADTPGRWLYHCHVAEHMQEGMFTKMEIFARDAVGVDRSPENAFLGLTAKVRSVRIDRAEVVTNLVSSPPTRKLLVAGVIAVPENFALTKTEVRVQFGGKTVGFHPDRQGMAGDVAAGLRIVAGDDAGVVHGGVMDFELSFGGAEWLALVAPAEGTTSAAAKPAIPLMIELGAAKHTALVTVTARTIP